jgi:hypothetical protein
MQDTGMHFHAPDGLLGAIIGPRYFRILIGPAIRPQLFTLAEQESEIA